MARNAGIGLQVPTTDISRLGPQITLQVLHTLRNTIDVEINLAQSRANANGMQQLQQTGLVQAGAPAGSSQTTTGRRQLSPQARKNIAKAQKQRWAQRKAAQAVGQVANGGVQARGPGRAKRSQRTMAAGAGMPASA